MSSRTLSAVVTDMLNATQTYLGVNQLANTANTLTTNAYLQQAMPQANLPTYTGTVTNTTNTYTNQLLPMPGTLINGPVTGGWVGGGYPPNALGMGAGSPIGLGGGGGVGSPQFGQPAPYYDAKSWFYYQLDAMEDQRNPKDRAYDPVPYDDRVNRLKDKRFFDIKKMDEQAIITFCLCNDVDPRSLIDQLATNWGAEFV